MSTTIVSEDLLFISRYELSSPALKKHQLCSVVVRSNFPKMTPQISLVAVGFLFLYFCIT